MDVTRNEVFELLDVEEPDYDAAAELGDDAVPFLVEMVTDGEALLAQKATSLAARISSPMSHEVIRIASAREEPAVRVAAAAALARMPQSLENSILMTHGYSIDPSDAVLSELLHDVDAGVRKFAQRSAQLRAERTLLDGKLDAGDQAMGPEATTNG